jgi:hypothetical protein
VHVGAGGSLPPTRSESVRRTSSSMRLCAVSIASPSRGRSDVREEAVARNASVYAPTHDGCAPGQGATRHPNWAFRRSSGFAVANGIPIMHSTRDTDPSSITAGRVPADTFATYSARFAAHAISAVLTWFGWCPRKLRWRISRTTRRLSMRVTMLRKGWRMSALC